MSTGSTAVPQHFSCALSFPQTDDVVLVAGGSPSGVAVAVMNLQTNSDGNLPFGATERWPNLARRCVVGSHRPDALGAYGRGVARHRTRPAGIPRFPRLKHTS